MSKKFHHNQNNLTKKIVKNCPSDFSWTSSISTSSYPDGGLYSALHNMVDSRDDNKLSYHIIKYDNENIVNTHDQPEP